MIDDTHEKYESSDISSCEEVESGAWSSLIDNTDEWSKSSEVSSWEQVQTSYMVKYTKGRISSEDLNNLYNGKTSLESKGSDKVVSDDKSDRDNNIYAMIKTLLGIKGLKIGS